MKRTLNRQEIGSQLPRPVLDRIRRYAQEGRQPLARYGADSCMLLAVAMGKPNVVILRSTRREFTEIRSAALVEWTRVARMKKPGTAGRDSLGRRRLSLGQAG
jgi:hypothetical protein